MKRAFLYIDILGFEKLVRDESKKVKTIFEILDGLNVHKHFALRTVVFSDTMLVFNNDNSYEDHYYVTYLIEYAQQLFYRLALHNVYFKAIITSGNFEFETLKNIDAYYGLALIDTYTDEKMLEGFGLYINKNISDDVIVFDKIEFNEKYDYVLLCQSLISLYKHTEGKLPVDIEVFEETDTFHRIDEDLRFLREVEYIKNNFTDKKIANKYQKVYGIYKTAIPKFFEKFEEEGFLPFTLNSDYIGNLNPFVILAEKEHNGT